MSFGMIYCNKFGEYVGYTILLNTACVTTINSFFSFTTPITTDHLSYDRVGGGSGSTGDDGEGGADLPEKLRGCDPQLIEKIENEIIDRGDPITFNDIAGLEFAKKSVMELVCWPMKRPDLFTVSVWNGG